MKYCPFCGAVLPDEKISFCLECGEKLSDLNLHTETEKPVKKPTKKEKKPNLKGCHVFSTKYNGKEKAFSDFKIDLKFEDFNDGRIIFHYIRFVDIEKGKKQNK